MVKKSRKAAKAQRQDKSVPPAVRGPQSGSPAGVQDAGGHSALGDPVWAVIGDFYVSTDLTYDQAYDEARRLRERKQPGVVIVTNETADRMKTGAEAWVQPSR